MDKRDSDELRPRIKHRDIDRAFNTPLFLLRCTELGLSMADLEYLSIGTIWDMFTEKNNDEFEYPYLATDEDIARL